MYLAEKVENEGRIENMRQQPDRFDEHDIAKVSPLIISMAIYLFIYLSLSIYNHHHGRQQKYWERL